MVGVGAIGGHLAAQLAQEPHLQVSGLARGKTLQVIRTQGIRVETPTHIIHAHINVSDQAAVLGRQDYVFITLKANQLRSAVASLQPLLGPDTVLIPPSTCIPYWYFYRHKGLQADQPIERLDPGGVLHRALPPERVLGCVFWTGVQVVVPGVVRQTGSVSGYPLGEPDGSHSERVLRLSKAMQAAGINAPVRTDIRAEIWMKMINSLCWNSVAVLTQASLGQMARMPHLIGLVRRMMVEAEKLASAFGVSIPVAIDKRISTALAASEHRMSMLEDLEAGRPLELSQLVDSLEAMKQISGVETPVIDDVLSLAILRAHTQPKRDEPLLTSN